MRLTIVVRRAVKALVLCVGVGFLLAPGAARADLVITGSSTILPIVKRAAAKFTQSTGIKVAASGGGSDHGARSALRGTADIGMVSRALHEDEARALVATTIGVDALAVFVHERNPVAGLTRAQVVDIYGGRISRWREVDPAAGDGQIVRVGKWHGRSTRELFDRFFGFEGQEYPAGTHMIGANVASILYVSLDPLAIGYVSVGSLDHAAKNGAPVKILPLDGVAPSRENILSGLYSYTRPLNLVTRGAPHGEVARFIAWMTSPVGRQAVRDEGFVSRAP